MQKIMFNDRFNLTNLVLSGQKTQTRRIIKPQDERLDYLREAGEVLTERGKSFVVVVEAGWLNKAHWHVGKGGSAARSAAIGNHTGRNHEVGRKIVEMCRHYGIEVVEQPPLRKMWKGRDGKITHEELQHLAIITGKTNQETRDAALIAWEYAGLPIQIKK